MKRPLRFSGKLVEWKIADRDIVEVVVGEEKGFRGEVLERHLKKNQMIVKGVNVELRRVRDNDSEKYMSPKVDKTFEVPIHYDDVRLVDPTDDAATDVVFRYLESGKKVRISTRSGAILPWPAKKPVDKSAEPVKLTPFTTSKEFVLETTYVPPNDILEVLTMKEMREFISKRGFAFDDCADKDSMRARAAEARGAQEEEARGTQEALQ